MSDLRRGLEQLHPFLLDEAPPMQKLAGLGPPSQLGLLLHLSLISALRAGPDAPTPRPGATLGLAQKATASGLLDLASLASLGEGLDHLSAELEASGAWDPVAPFWWQPLPTPSGLEECWRELRQRGETTSLPGRDDLRTALESGKPGWLHLPELLPGDLIATAHGQLEAAYGARHLDLRREGVGASGRLSASRSDSVLYLNGLEPDLLQQAPSAAALIQWTLQRLAHHLGQILPGGPCFPPQKVMLARYPAPSGGYHAHLDNPGDDGGNNSQDNNNQNNGRAFTLVLYLNHPAEPCQGGELDLWRPGQVSSEPATARLPAIGGDAALFDARRVAHQVLPLRQGPPRWALTLWLNARPQGPLPQPLPRPKLRDALIAVTEPPLAPDKLIFHELDESDSSGHLHLRTLPPERPRIALVSTVYGGGESLLAFCQHHLAMGVDHLFLIFDHLQENAEAETAARLRERWDRQRLTLWSGEETRRLWATLPARAKDKTLFALATEEGSSYAVAARQTLNASLALEAARSPAMAGGESAGGKMDWLLHLDADERFHLEGPGRGGASLGEHFASAEAAGLSLLRYLNHERLPRRETQAASDGQAPIYKLNPRLAIARLGPKGWRALVQHLCMGQKDPRPYFLGYHNGKSAVRVAAAEAAAGVHGFYLKSEHEGQQRLLAGPSVLHSPCLSATGFRRKYLAKGRAIEPVSPLPFQPSPVEEAALGLIRQLERQAADAATRAAELDHLFHRLTHFTAEETAMLQAAGLLFSPCQGALAEPDAPTPSTSYPD